MQSLPPHGYAVTAYAHKQMMNSKKRQAIVISGESGAGKTESAKQCMKYLTSLGSRKIPEEEGLPDVGVRILDTNPVLEAFGNSKTARNNNSSRFGKYIKIYFDLSTGNVTGAQIKNYLLEKSRVVGNTKLERNYHAFFFMLRGLNDAEAKKYGYCKPDGSRKKPEDFKSLKVYSDLPVKKTRKGDLTGE